MHNWLSSNIQGQMEWVWGTNDMASMSAQSDTPIFLFVGFLKGKVDVTELGIMV
jgi:hypothetical protein